MELFTDQYDEEICENLKHLQNYPEMKPFIGRNWDASPYKILLLGESHYIVGNELSNAYVGRSHTTDWYNNTSVGFHDYYSNYINTRKVVDKADKVKERGFAKPLTIYYRLKDSIKEHYPELKSEEFVFPYLSYYNYFQRPAFVERESIINNETDNKIAYSTLKKVSEVIKPSKIIFCSREAYFAFKSELGKDATKEMFSEIIVDNVPHPSSAWWNRKSRACGGQTGQQKFMDILKQ
jgi:hypothetical protein